MKHLLKKSLALLLCVCFMMTSVVVLSADAKQDYTKSRFSEVSVDGDYSLMAIVTFDDASLAELNYTSEDIKDGKADAAIAKIERKQAEFVNKLEGKASLRYSYNAVLNGVAVETKFSELKNIEKMDGVKKVFIANNYDVPKVMVGNEKITSAFYTAGNGYDGKGTVVAVLDTGLNITHEAFQDYGLTEDVITEEMVNSFKGNAYNGAYINKKVPFSFDYADWDTDVTDTDGHGTHCAGIAVGYNGDDFVGTAPGAQLVDMKIFHDGKPGTNSGIYFAALDDCYTLGVDVISMSIGSPCGFTYDYELEYEFGNIYETLENAGIITVMAAGNEYNQGYYSENWVSASYSYGLAANIDYSTVSSPSTYKGNISVASIENPTYITDAYTAGTVDYVFAYNTTENYETVFDDAFGGTSVEYVFFDGLGIPDDFEGFDLKDKIAVVQRGAINFQDKLYNAEEAGAAGIIVYNNVPGQIAMQIDDMVIPAISITQEDGAKLKELYEAGDAIINVTKTTIVLENPNAYMMSDFSDWGPTPELKVAPQITGVGGQVSSASISGDDKYITYSGTSMATPNVAGMFAQLLQYLRSEYPEMEKKETADMAEDLALSSAMIYSDSYGEAFPVNKQGTGVFNIYSAMNYANAYFTNPISDGMGNANSDGTYTFSYEIKRQDASTEEIFTITPEFYIDYPERVNWSNEGEEPDYSYYNTYSAGRLTAGSDCDYIFETGLENDTLVFAEGETTKTVEFTVTLTDDMKDTINEYFANGTYVYGYVFVDAPNTSTHGTALAFYGDWDAIPYASELMSFEIIDMDYFLNTTVVDEYGNTYADYGYTWVDMADEFDLGATYIFNYNGASEKPNIGYFGDNLFDYLPYNSEHNSVTNAANGSASVLYEGFMMYPVLYRNCRHAIMTVSNAETGEVYYVDDTEYARKNLGSYAAGECQTLFGWSGEIVVAGNVIDYVPNGTKVHVDFSVQGDFESAELHSVYEFDLTVDYVAPELVYHYDAETRTVTYTAADDRFIQGIEWYDDMEHYDELIVPADDTLGAVYEGSFVVPENIRALSFDIADYAGNVTTGSISTLKEDCTNSTYTVKSRESYDSGFAIVPISECDYMYEIDSYYYELVEGNEFKFALFIEQGYTATEDFSVTLGDGTELVLEYDEENDFYFTSFTPTGDDEVIVEGVADITAPEIDVYPAFSDEAIEVTGDAPVSAKYSFAFELDPYDYGSGVIEMGYFISDESVEVEDEFKNIEWKINEFYGVVDGIGSKYLNIYAMDTAGNTSFKTIPFVLDGTGPVYGTMVIDNGCGVRVYIVDVYSDIDVNSIEVIAYDAISEKTFDYDAVISTDAETKNITVEISGLSDGSYEFMIKASDTLGNESLTAIALDVKRVPEISSDKVYYGIKAEGATVAEVKAMFGNDITVLDSESAKLDDDAVVGTGCKVVADGGETEYPIVITGDVDGDGAVAAKDYVLIKRAYLGSYSLKGVYETAARISGESEISAIDYLMVKRHVLGTYNIFAD